MHKGNAFPAVLAQPRESGFIPLRRISGICTSAGAVKRNHLTHSESAEYDMKQQFHIIQLSKELKS
jgi:hypothetical protein